MLLKKRKKMKKTKKNLKACTPDDISNQIIGENFFWWSLKIFNFLHVNSW